MSDEKAKDKLSCVEELRQRLQIEERNKINYNIMRGSVELEYSGMSFW